MIIRRSVGMALIGLALLLGLSAGVVWVVENPGYLRGAQGPQGDQGPAGRDGKDGRPGRTKNVRPDPSPATVNNYYIQQSGGGSAERDAIRRRNDEERRKIEENNRREEEPPDPPKTRQKRDDDDHKSSSHHGDGGTSWKDVAAIAVSRLPETVAAGRGNYPHPKSGYGYRDNGRGKNGSRRGPCAHGSYGYCSHNCNF